MENADFIRLVIETTQEKIEDENLILSDVKKQIKGIGNMHILTTSIINAINDSLKRYKYTVQKQDTMFIKSNLLRDNYPFDELDYKGEVYPFKKARLVIDEENNAIVQYVFNGGRKEIDTDSLFKKLVDILKTDVEFIYFVKSTWPEGFKNQSDKELFNEVSEFHNSQPLRRKDFKT